MKQAVIDVGSNSVRLLAMEEGRVLARGTITTRLMNGVVDGQMERQAMETTARAIEEHAQRARAMGIERLYAFGTSAVRDAANQGMLISRVRELCGLELEVMSGEQEAALAYAGAAPRGQSGVIDIGGGSTELLCGSEGRVLKSASAQLGAVRLMNRVGSDRDAEDLLGAAREMLAPAVRQVQGAHAEGWIGVGGTITSLAAMDLQLEVYDPERIEGYPISRAAAQHWLRRLCAMDVEQRCALPGLQRRRAEIIAAGAAVLCAFFEAFPGADCVRASEHDNLEGFLRMKAKQTREIVDKT